MMVAITFSENFLSSRHWFPFGNVISALSLISTTITTIQRTEAYVDDDKLEVVAPATVKHGSPHLRDAAEEFGVDCYAILLLLLQLQMLVCFETCRQRCSLRDKCAHYRRFETLKIRFLTDICERWAAAKQTTDMHSFVGDLHDRI